MIEDGVSGRLVPQGDVPGLADALASVLRDPALRRALAQGAGTASARFDTDAIAAQWLHIVDEAVTSG